MLSSSGDINPKSFVKVSWGIIMALFANFKSDHIIAIMTTENGNAAMINKF
jgi:hypothetical protein